MSGVISREAGFWLYAVALGVQLLFLYDLLRILRRIIPHRLAAIGAEDFCYWMVGGCLIFRMLYRYNYGIIRWFAVLGMLAGMLLYHLTVSRHIVRLGARWLGKLFAFLFRPLRFIFHKFRTILAFLVGKRKKITISAKNKLKSAKKDSRIKAVFRDGSVTVGKEKYQKKKKKTAKATKQANAD